MTMMAESSPSSSSNRSRWRFGALTLVLALGLTVTGSGHGSDGGVPGDEPPLSESMVLIPAGPFYKGCNPPVCPDFFFDCCSSDEWPQHEVITPAYFIDRTEATVARYRRCVEAGMCSVPEDRGPACNYARPNREQHPVTCLETDEAEALCAFEGKRLCSESEWEKAAHGGCELYPEGLCAASVRPFPFGGYSASTLCAFMNYNEGGFLWRPGGGCGLDSTWEAGSRPLASSPYGVFDLVGNAAEHTADCRSRNYEDTPRDGSAHRPSECPGGRAKRGGNYSSPVFHTYSWSRNGSITHDDDYSCCGVRCCRDGGE